MKSVDSYAKLETLGRVRLSPNFFMRDFLYSEIAAWHQLLNVPDLPERAIESARRLCMELLEPLQATFGRVHIRSGYRSPLVNGFGNEHELGCATNESNFGAHIWDYPDSQGCHGAAACIVVPWLVDHVAGGGSWTDMAWWIHDHLNYSSLWFFPKLAAFNINWHENPVRRIDSYVRPLGCLTKPGMENHAGLHEDQYRGFPELLPSQTDREHVCDASSFVRASGGEVISPSSPSTASSIAAGSGTTIIYRAVHVRTAWRKAFNHKTLESALHGVNGAAGLFAGRARIDYTVHGDPKYVLVWESNRETGYAVRRASGAAGLDFVQVPIDELLVCEARGMADTDRLDEYFARAEGPG
jgi:hypothetical protein